MKLFLYSLAFTFSDKQARALSDLAGKKPGDTTIALIDNAADVIPDSKGWVADTHGILQKRGYKTEVVNLKQTTHENLRQKLTGKDIIWVNAGNTFYLRWIMKKSGADKVITELVKKGTVYAGWSAGAIVAGPTLKCVENMEDTKPAPEIILDGLNLTSVVVVPHMDNPDFADAAKKTDAALKKAGFTTQPLTDSQALVIDGKSQRIV